MSDIMGLNLSVDSNVMATAAREAIVSSVAEQLNMKDQLVQEFVKSLLTEKVNVEGGSPKRFSGEDCCSRMEYILRKAFGETVKEEIAAMIEEQKPEIREAIKKELSKNSTKSKLVDMFVKSISDAVTCRYTAKVNIEFDQNKGD